MNKKITVTFKKQPRGTWDTVFFTEIKIKKQCFGLIINGRGVNNTKIQIAINCDKTENNPTSWKWIILKKIFVNDGDAREWIKNNIVEIQEKFNLHFFDN